MAGFSSGSGGKNRRGPDGGWWTQDSRGSSYSRRDYNLYDNDGNLIDPDDPIHPGSAWRKPVPFGTYDVYGDPIKRSPYGRGSGSGRQFFTSGMAGQQAAGFRPWVEDKGLENKRKQYEYLGQQAAAGPTIAQQTPAFTPQRRRSGYGFI